MTGCSGFTGETRNTKSSTGKANTSAKLRGYYTTSQLARRWGVSAITIIRLIEEGDLQGLKIRGCYRISQGSIQNYETSVSF